jgi:hypothetical protein
MQVGLGGAVDHFSHVRDPHRSAALIGGIRRIRQEKLAV